MGLVFQSYDVSLTSTGAGMTTLHDTFRQDLVLEEQNMQDDLESMGPLRLKEVDEAQTKLVQLTKDLAEKGEIVLSKGSAEDELVY